ncbi:MAG: hypothetical protein WAW17_33625, partial [Rhodococcus sp. (in: high G+C Gram-positive bacteria)]|uniref:hypothetical protein n=1 Tax=Rhodococcus sp. TaxID=1831 RepID=UPI003BAE859A
DEYPAGGRGHRADLLGRRSGGMAMTEQWPPSPPSPPDQAPGHQQYGHQQYGHQQYGHQQDGAPQYGYPPQPAPEPERPVPVDVGTAAQLLWIVAGLGLVQALAAMIIVVGERATFVDELMNNPGVVSGEVDITRENVEMLFYVGIGLTVAIIVLLTALFLLFVRFMRKGRNWARMLVSIVSVMMIVWTVPVLFGLGSDGSTTSLVVGGVQILQAVVALGAVVLMHRKDSNSYFLRFPPPAE